MIAGHEDLLMQIFLWLPAKSLIRFKLVCKRWFSIITSHHFCHQHTLHHRHQICRFTPKPSLLLCLADSSNYFHIQHSPYGENLVPYRFSPAVPIIRGFSNGLFLLQYNDPKQPLEDCHVYNPTTKESRKISLNHNDNYRRVVGLNLAFDPSKSTHYKIICVRAIRRRSSSIFWRSWWHCCQVEVYESDIGAWRLCGDPFLAPNDMLLHQGIYWKGSIHWRGIFFDIHECVVGKHPDIVFPADTRTTMVYDHYVESNGYLHYIAHFPEEKSVMVFELPGDYSEWSLKYRINVNIFTGPLSQLSVIRGESEEDDTLVVHEPGKIMAYIFKDKSIKEMINFQHEPFYQEQCVQFFPHLTFQYIETLAPP